MSSSQQLGGKSSEANAKFNFTDSKATHYWSKTDIGAARQKVRSLEGAHEKLSDQFGTIERELQYSRLRRPTPPPPTLAPSPPKLSSGLLRLMSSRQTEGDDAAANALRQRLAAAEEENASLRANADENERRNAKLEENQRALNNDLNTARDSIRNLEADVADFRNQAKNAADNADRNDREAENRARALEERAQRAENERNAAQNQINEAEASAKAARDRVSKSDVEIQALKAVINEHRATVASLTKTLECIEQDARTLSNASGSEQGSLIALPIAARRLTAELENSVSDPKLQLANNEGSKENNDHALYQDLELVNQRAADFKRVAQNAIAEAEISLRQENNVANGNVVQNDTQNAKLCAELNSARQRAADLERTAQDAFTQVENAKARAEELGRSVDTLFGEKLSLQKSAEQAQRAKRDLADGEELLSNQIANMERISVSLINQRTILIRDEHQADIAHVEAAFHVLRNEMARVLGRIELSITHLVFKPYNSRRQARTIARQRADEFERVAQDALAQVENAKARSEELGRSVDTLFEEKRVVLRKKLDEAEKEAQNLRASQDQLSRQLRDSVGNLVNSRDREADTGDAEDVMERLANAENMAEQYRSSATEALKVIQVLRVEKGRAANGVQENELAAAKAMETIQKVVRALDAVRNENASLKNKVDILEET
ncbi:hypothetical protein HK101_003218, partial [Irineochytrium annulatum]